MNKNNKKTMNERTHNPYKVYQKDKNTNSNNQKMQEEFGEESQENSQLLSRSSKVRNRQQGPQQ